MTTVSEIPLVPQQQKLSISLGSWTYEFRFLYVDTPEGGWIMDIVDAVSGKSLVCGIPLVTGHDLLEQYNYLAIGGKLIVATPGDADSVPTYANLGVASHLYYVTEP